MTVRSKPRSKFESVPKPSAIVVALRHVRGNVRTKPDANSRCCRFAYDPKKVIPTMPIRSVTLTGE